MLLVTGVTPTTTSIASSGSPGNYQLTATVVGFGGVTPSGTVSFLDTSNNNAALGTAMLGNAATSTAVGLIAIGDFNGDGILDVSTPNTVNNTVSIFLGNGDGTFSPTVVSPATGSYPGQIVAADFNQDRKLDLVVQAGGPGMGDKFTVLLETETELYAE